jgi:hypothetical protein
MWISDCGMGKELEPGTQIGWIYAFFLFCSNFEQKFKKNAQIYLIPVPEFYPYSPFRNPHSEIRNPHILLKGEVKDYFTNIPKNRPLF